MKYTENGTYIKKYDELNVCDIIDRRMLARMDYVNPIESSKLNFIF